MKNKGFTLVELLAVIVILAIIALIAVPIVLNVINNSKESADESSAKYYIKAVENTLSSKQMSDSKVEEGAYSITKDGNICLGIYKDENCTGEIFKVESDKTRPTGGSVYIKNANVRWYKITINGKDYEEGELTGEVNVAIAEKELREKFNLQVKVGDTVNYDHKVDANGNPVATQSYTSYSATNASADKNNGRTSGYDNDQVFNVSSYGGTWKVLGVEDGKVLLISDTIIGPDSGGNTANANNYYFLKGKAGYEYAVAELDAISNLYAQGKGAESGRSIKVEDVNKLTGYNPETSNYGKGQMYEYGNKVTYYWDGTKNPYYESENGETGKVYNWTPSFYLYEDLENGIGSLTSQNASTTATTANKQLITTLTSTYYSYYPITLNEDQEVTNEQISTASPAIKLLFENTDANTYGKFYWLASRYLRVGKDGQNRHEGSYYGVHLVWGNMVAGNALISVKGDQGPIYRGIRAVITLSEDVQLTDSNSDGIWEIN